MNWHVQWFHDDDLLKYSDDRGEWPIDDQASGELRHQERKHERHPTEFQPALIIRNDAQHWPNFIPRNENNIINLSSGGVLLKAHQPLEHYHNTILLLLCLDSQQPYNQKNQICLRGEVVREAEEVKNESTPYAYGIRFQNIRPFETEKIQQYINKIKNPPEHKKESIENKDALEVLKTLDDEMG